MVAFFHLLQLCMKAPLHFYCTLEWASLIPATLHAPFISPSLPLPQCLFSSSRGLWPALTGRDDGSFNRCRWAEGAQVGCSRRPEEEGWTTHLLLLTAVSRAALWGSFIPQPHALLSAMVWHWLQSHTCSPLLSFVWLLSRAMWGVHFCKSLLLTHSSATVSLQRQGRCDTFATEFDLEAEEYVPLPKGDVHKKKEIVQDVTLHDLDVANARPQVCYCQLLFVNSAAVYILQNVLPVWCTNPYIF